MDIQKVSCTFVTFSSLASYSSVMSGEKHFEKLKSIQAGILGLTVSGEEYFVDVSVDCAGNACEGIARDVGERLNDATRSRLEVDEKNAVMVFGDDCRLDGAVRSAPLKNAQHQWLLLYVHFLKNVSI